jgi:hypothetical protein
MTNTPTPLDPIAQLVAKYQSNGQTTSTQQPTQTAPQPKPKPRKDQIGFRGKTLWDWLNLLGVLLVPLMIGAGTIWVTNQQALISQDQHKSDQAIALDQQRATTLKTYMDDITQLLLYEGLRESKAEDAAVRVTARAKTLLTSGKKTKGNSQHAHNTGKE